MADIPQETLNWFNGDDLRARTFAEKYALRDLDGNLLETTPDQMWDRIAGEIASVEGGFKQAEWHNKFNWLLDDFRMIPGGRIMFGAGNPRQATLLNCYVIPVESDTLEGIFEWCSRAAKTYAYGGGVGTDISVLRPKGTPVNNSAQYSSGAVSFMDLFSNVTGTIGQSGRRGALMQTISANHPDLIDFINVKNDDGRKSVEHANISVRITEDFMQAVKDGTKHTLRYESDEVPPQEIVVDAREVWGQLIEAAHSSAEPGIIFWDNVKKESTTEYNGMEVITTNPCSLTGDTQVFTPRGVFSLEELTSELGESREWPEVVVDERAGDGTGISTRDTSFIGVTGFERIWEVELSNGATIRGTCDHKIKTDMDGWDEEHESTGWARIDELSEGDRVLCPKTSEMTSQCFWDRTWELGIDKQSLDARRSDAEIQSLIREPDKWDTDVAWMMGYIVGNGHYTSSTTITIYYHQDDEDYLAGEFNKITERWIGASFAPSDGEGEKTRKVAINSSVFRRFLYELGLDYLSKSDKEIPKTIMRNAPEEVVSAFLRGLFDADGTISLYENQNSYHLSLGSISDNIVHNCRLLLAQWGISAGVSTTVSGGSSSGLFYETQSGEARQYESVHDFMRCVVTGQKGAVLFRDSIGFSLPRKRERLGEVVGWYNRSGVELRGPRPYSKVVSVRDTGKTEPVYDLTEPVTKSFLANGVIVSNSEIPLEPFGNCCLGNINLSKFVKSEFSDDAEVDWPSLSKAAQYTTRFLDNVLDYNADKHPLQEQKDASLYSRRIGVGFTGLGDMLIKLGYKYDSDEAVDFVDTLFHDIKKEVYEYSAHLASEKGAFPAYDEGKHLESPFFEDFTPDQLDRIRQNGLRNAALLTVPPVGSGSILAGCTSGIEPIFATSYTRKSKSLSQESFKTYHPQARRYMEEHGLSDDNELPDTFVTAHDIDPFFRVKMQATIQQHIDHAISSTVNLHRDISVDEVKRIYEYAHDLGCKGITVYREGSREGILLTDQAEQPAQERTESRERPAVTHGKTYRLATEMGNLYVTVNSDSDGLIELFPNLGKSGSASHAFTEALGRLTSLCLRKGVAPADVIEELDSIKGTRPMVQEDGTIVQSVPDAIAKALQRALESDGRELPHIEQAALCPECGGVMVNQNGCSTCHECGYSKCD